MRMNHITQFFDNLFSQFNNIDFALLVLIDLSAFALVFIIALICCALSPRVRAGGKRAFLHLVNLFTAVTLTVFLSAYSLTEAVAASAFFWCAGYLLYGFLCLFKNRKKRGVADGGVQFSHMEQRQPELSRPQLSDGGIAAQSVVRLDHALSISDKLLLKNLGRSDRQELEKIKTSLSVLKVKEGITPQEGEHLNEMFNALLKLMAKYDV